MTYLWSEIFGDGNERGKKNEESGEISDMSSFGLSHFYLSAFIENFQQPVILLFYQNPFLEKDREISPGSKETNSVGVWVVLSPYQGRDHPFLEESAGLILNQKTVQHLTETAHQLEDQVLNEGRARVCQ